MNSKIQSFCPNRKIKRASKERELIPALFTWVNFQYTGCLFLVLGRHTCCNGKYGTSTS